MWNYEVYTNPMPSRLERMSLVIDVPASYGQKTGFHFTTPANANAKGGERYRLEKIHFRKPAVAYAGLGQALNHVLEMVLVHKQMDGTYWANVILPFQVTTDGAAIDLINPMISNQALPSRVGELTYLLKTATSQMDLVPAFQNATFSTFWGTAADEGCPTNKSNVRYFMRTGVLFVGVDTFKALSKVLDNSPTMDPTAPPAVTWVVSTCKNGTKCEILKEKVPLATKLQNSENAKTAALNMQNARKANLTTLIANLSNHKGPATNSSISMFQKAVVAYQDLKAAQSRYLSAVQQVNKYQKEENEVKSAKWDSDKPVPGGNSSQANKTSFLSISSRSSMQSLDCSAMGLSPVDIESRKAMDPSAFSPGLLEPLAFRYMTPNENMDPPHLKVSHLSTHFRVAVPPGSLDWPLGGVLSSGVLRGVSYVDIKVPGEHSVDGRAPAAELQLVHESVNGKPAMSVAVPLELSEDDSENSWLKPLLMALPDRNFGRLVLGQPLGLAHGALSLGATGRYYRYDGSLTTPPCHRTEWFVLAEPGRVSRHQLAVISDAIGTMQHSGPPSPARKASLVMIGTPHLVDHTAETGRRPFLSRLIARTRVQV
jgi:carbonic anhydrase